MVLPVHGLRLFRSNCFNSQWRNPSRLQKPSSSVLAMVRACVHHMYVDDDGNSRFWVHVDAEPTAGACSLWNVCMQWLGFERPGSA